MQLGGRTPCQIQPSLRPFERSSRNDPPACCSRFANSRVWRRIHGSAGLKAGGFASLFRFPPAFSDRRHVTEKSLTQAGLEGERAVLEGGPCLRAGRA